MAEPLESHQTNILIPSTNFFNKVRVMIGHAWVLREEESPLYMLYGHILTTFCETAGDPLDVNRALGCEPQSSFTAQTQTSFERRVPDFTVMVTFLPGPDVLNRFSPSYIYPTLGFWLEVKPLYCRYSWMSDEGQQKARWGIWSHLAQLNEQGVFAFRHFAGDKFYAMLVLGIYFSVFEYSRPAHIPLPTRLQPPPTPHPRHTDSTRTQKRPKRKRGDDVTTYKVQTNAKQAMERKTLSLSIDDPKTLYYCEPILTQDGQAFNPLFQKALQDIITARGIDIPIQPSFFTPPPGDCHVSEASLDKAHQEYNMFKDNDKQQRKSLDDAVTYETSSEEDTSGVYRSSVRPSNTGATRRTRSQSRDDALSEGDLDVPYFEDTDDADDNAHGNIEDDIHLGFDLDLGRGTDDDDDANDDEAENNEDDEAENVWQYSRRTSARGRESTR